MSSIFTLSEHKRSTNKALAGKGKKTYNRGTEIRLSDKNFCRPERRKRRKRMVPQDPVMLLSFLNLKLRDFYGSLDALCEDLDLNREEILEKMKQIDYTYDEGRNQFV